MRRSPSTFPLRFESERTRAALHDLSEEMGVSMNKLAQDAVVAHLDLVTSLLEDRLARTLEALRRYRGTWSDDEIAAFARAEVRHADPAEGASAQARESDPFGVLRAFADPLER
jgi:predicted RecB family endonuclease